MGPGMLSRRGAGGEGRWSSGQPLFAGSLCAVGANMPCDLKGDMGSLS